MSWDYADLSHMAKEAGGPDLLLSTLEAAARSRGRIEGAGIGALVAGAVLTGGALVYNQYAKRKQLAAEAKAALITGIHEFEASDPAVTAVDDDASCEDGASPEEDQDSTSQDGDNDKE